MSQRVSGFKRLPSESYDTIEAWPVCALLTHLPIRSAWDPCEGGGSLLAALQRYGVEAVGTGHDFFTIRKPPVEVDAIVMNPPYGEQRRGELAVRFLEHALTLPVQYIAALLPIDFDSAIGRQHLFRQCPSFIGKIVLLGPSALDPGFDRFTVDQSLLAALGSRQRRGADDPLRQQI
jgi:hypothetical protein